MLLIGFVPSVILMVASSLADYSALLARIVFILACVGGMACCFFASRSLFKRKTSLAIAGGVVLLVLNVLVSMFAGCAALFSH